ncbi:hypothetical protein [Leeuwenhoekiella palythoae]|uniref:DUF4177 domain-containing protein n=1 Tax=Leeuwenhoekiella palythoae TaxID=573501 RepID=A0A1M5YWF8_9FLAO|nr:hypothetical protein [Leeuwenhoekiella palythoae]MEC7784799.1 hypothetical protein [Bacteroidota bacterium]RXG29563.1 hypothetical protein DSM01_1665 [Leeuwenhoekiella palythoae]UBZ11403.1 hypothetical protein LDL79_04620 [Leeuwenhoekiella palythoae]SHI15873.1 hypothetical protein SAMN04487999_2390 [Leeuwenhoekiella palythoae]
MEYKVIPFIASIDRSKENTKQVAEQLEALIKNQTADGWNYERLESVSSYVQPTQGCFSFGGEQGYSTAHQMVVFSRDF